MLLWCLQDGDTALMRASKGGHLGVVKHLVEHKADVNFHEAVSKLCMD